jgi:hypothetical protein
MLELVGRSLVVMVSASSTQQPKEIPKDGSPIRVFVDGVPLGTVTYDLFRSDVAALFPGLANSGGAAAGVSAMDGDVLEDVRIMPVQRLAISVADPRDAECVASYVGYLDANRELRDLPAGLTLERKGVLRWQPGPAFRGRYDFLVVRTACGGVRTTRRISATVHP